jgi:hypothetical protein
MGVFLHKLLVSLNAISAQQAKARIHTEQLVETLLNYLTTYPNDFVCRASGMVLCTHADAGYLNETRPAAEQVHISNSWKMIKLHSSTAGS